MSTFRHRVAGAAIAAATLVTASAPTASAATWSDWWSRSSVHVHQMQDAFEDAFIATRTGDLTALHNACAALHDATEGMEADLPSPDPALTTTLQAAMDDYHAGAMSCDSAVHEGSASALSVAESYLGQGNTHMQQAINILQNEPV
jgi:hypothetical protein